MYLVMPLFALFMTRVVSLTYAVAITIVALSISRFHLSCQKDHQVWWHWTLWIGVDGHCGRYLNRPFALGPESVAKLLVLSVLIPLAAGIIFRKFAQATAERLSGPLIHSAGIALIVADC
jgi:ACR3 family arsenite efflux pump ArsB